MIWQEMAYVIVLITATAVSALSALYVWLRYPVTGSKTVVLFMLAGAEWTLGYTLELASADILIKDWLNKMQYVGIVIVPTASLVFALQYTNRKQWLKRRNLILLSIIPFTILILALTNEFHGLFWGPIDLDRDAPFSILYRSHRIGYWIHAIYSYGVLLVAIGFMIQALIRSHHLYRRQASFLVLAICLPLLGHLLMLFGLNPLPYLDLTPLAFTLAGTILTLSLFRLRVGDIVPVARGIVIESMDDGVLVLDDQNRVVDLNPVAQRMTGCRAPQAIGRLVEDAWPDCPSLADQSGDGAGIDEEVILSDGDGRRIYDVLVSPINDWRGRLTSRVVVLRDITERKEAEEALQASEEMARAILNASTESMMLTDARGTILALNQKAATELGKPAQRIFDLNLMQLCEQLFPAPVARLRTARINEALDSGEPIRFEEEHDGMVFDHNLYPILDGRGRVKRLALFTRDITAQKRAEQQAIRAERLGAMGQLAAALAHEINNPLQAIHCNLELALDFDLEAEEREERLNIARQEIGRLVEITQRVLGLAASDGGDRCLVPIAHLVQKTLALMDKQLQLAEIEVATDLPSELPPLFVAPSQILQVLLNLIINAMEAMPQGGELQITARTEGDMIALDIINEGPPLAPEAIEQLFDPFFTTKPDGTGLGLYLSQHVIRQHGGMIRLTNSPDGQGVTFTVTLPTASEERA